MSVFQLLGSEASARNLALIRAADHVANLALKFSREDSSIFSSEELFPGHPSHTGNPVCLHEAGDEKRWEESKEILLSSLRVDVMLSFPLHLHLFVAQTV